MFYFKIIQRIIHKNDGQFDMVSIKEKCPDKIEAFPCYFTNYFTGLIEIAKPPLLTILKLILDLLVISFL